MIAPQDKRRSRQGSSALEDIEIELTLLAFRGLLPTMIAAVVSSVGVCTTLAIHYGDRFLALWAVVTLVVSSTRTAVVHRFSRLGAAQLTMESAQRSKAVYGAITLLHCGILSVVAFYSFHSLSHEAQWLCTIGIFSICLGLSSRSGMSPRIIQASGGVLLATLAVCMALGQQRMRWAAVVILVFFIGQFTLAIQIQFNGAVEQLRIRRQLRLLSEQDVLTGLSNRRHFENSLSRLCAANMPFAVLFIDLDRFKQVNDTHGHGAGDTLLIEVAERLGGAIRSSDLLARLGGDEFAILQSPLLAAESASALAARINHDIAQPFRIDGRDIHIGASIGIRLSATGTADADTLLSNADKALYRVKQAGGGSFSLATA